MAKNPAKAKEGEKGEETLLPKNRGRRIGLKNKDAKSILGWPFTLKNLFIGLGGLVVLVVGFYFLAQGPHDAASSMTVGPLLLLLGYLVVLPLAILFKDKSRKRS